MDSKLFEIPTCQNSHIILTRVNKKETLLLLTLDINKIKRRLFICQHDYLNHHHFLFMALDSVGSSLFDCSIYGIDCSIRVYLSFCEHDLFH